MAFPATRLRRLRINPLLRASLQETELSSARLIAPLFVRSGHGVRRLIPSMPGQAQLSIDELLQEAQILRHRGIPAVLLFGIPAHKDPRGSQAYAKNGIVQQAVRALKKALPDLLVLTDLCFCEYTTHGHCGVLKGKELDNDATLELIAKTAVSQAEAGADLIAPSGMIDGMVKTIRQALDRQGFENTGIMSYAAKYASAFYGPFRDAAESAPQFGDRRSYQMDPANAEEALREVGLDIQEGADIVMVKPALAYLDIIRLVKETYHVPVAAYNVSGEYSMVKAAAQKGWIEESDIVREILTGIRRAGADLIITYHAKELAASGKPAS
jgi:porphobilinogen synthase